MICCYISLDSDHNRRIKTLGHFSENNSQWSQLSIKNMKEAKMPQNALNIFYVARIPIFAINEK